MKPQLPGRDADNENSLISGLENVKEYLGDKVMAVQDLYDSQRFEEAWKNFKTQLSEIGNKVEDKKTELFAAATVFLQDKELLNWTKQLTDGAATEFDRAMDYVNREKPVGGYYHRLFDGGHTIVGSWQAGKEALGEDASILDWAYAYMKDLTTPMGMPYVTLEKDSFDRWVDNFAGTIPGVDRQYLYDLLTFDALEIVTTGLSVAAVCFVLKKHDEERLAEILGAMGISSITAANPIMGLATIFVTAYAYWKHGRIDVVGLIKGGGLTAFSAFMFSIMGLPVMVEFAIVLSLSIILKKYLFENTEFAAWLRNKIVEALSGPKELLNFQNLRLSLTTEK